MTENDDIVEKLKETERVRTIRIMASIIDSMAHSLLQTFPSGQVLNSTYNQGVKDLHGKIGSYLKSALTIGGRV